MDVVITTAYPDAEPISTLRQLVEQDRFGVHRSVDDPEAADLILFVENVHFDDDPFYKVLRKHPWLPRYSEKTFMYNGHDRPYCTLPGVYASMPKRYFDRSRQRAGGYILTSNPYIEDTARAVASPDLLFSFAGRCNAPVRKEVIKLRHPEGHIWDTAHYDPYVGVNRGAEPMKFAQLMGRSRFVICPRGIGTGTHRVFETMQAGRVPVIVSDEWVEPDGPQWDRFSIRVREADVHRIPEIVSEADSRWSELASNARAVWEEWFAPEVKFHRLVENCVEIMRTRTHSEQLPDRIPRPVRLYAKNRARAMARQVKERVLGRR